MNAKRFIITGLAIGLLAFGTANAWAAAQFNALREYDHFKFEASEADDWIQSGKGNQLQFECIDDSDGCEVVVVGVGVGAGNPIKILYTCAFGAKLLLLPSGILILQNDCDGSLIQ